MPGPVGGLTYHLRGLIKVFLLDLHNTLAKRIPGIFSPFIAWQYVEIVLDYGIRNLLGVFCFSICLEPDQSALLFQLFHFGLCCFQFSAPSSCFIHSFIWDNLLPAYGVPSIYFTETNNTASLSLGTWLKLSLTYPLAHLVQGKEF